MHLKARIEIESKEREGGMGALHTSGEGGEGGVGGQGTRRSSVQWRLKLIHFVKS